MSDKDEIARIRKTLDTLIAWIATSAGSPISIAEARELLKMLHGVDDDGKKTAE